MEKLIRINELIKVTGFSRPTVTKLLQNIANKGSTNTIFNRELKIYGVRNLDNFYREINDNGNINNNSNNNEVMEENKRLCLQRNKKEDYIKEVISIGWLTQEEQLKAGSQLRQKIFKRQ